MRELLASLAVGSLLVWSGCEHDGSSPIAPVPVLPQPWLGEALYACESWTPEKPSAEFMLADIAVRPDRPLAEQVQMLQEHHAAVMHVFHVPLVRVIMPVDSVEALAKRSEIAHARGVADSTSFFVHELVLGYGRPVGEADSAALGDLGVLVHASLIGKYFLVSAEDEVLPLVWNMPDVSSVELSYFACQGGPPHGRR